MAEGLLSGVLPAVYSGADAFKRKLIDALRNPGDTIQNMVANANASAREHKALMGEEAAYTTQALRAGKIADALRGGPAGQKLTEAVAAAYNPAGITVWHGSPHRFTKFDSSKIGTGEGAQAYGHGLYVAESPEVARGYRDKLAVGNDYVDGQLLDSSNPRHFLAKALSEASGRKDEALEFLQDMAKPGGAKSVRESAVRAIELLRSGELPKVQHIKPEGALYKIDLPDEHVARMLDWDRRLSEQGNPALQQWFNSQKTYPGGYAYNEHTGETLYKALRGRGLSADQASAQLREAGIPGIRYLDGGSRGQGKGTSNFVVFPGNEDLLTIQEINGQPVQAVIDALRRSKQ